MVEPRFYLVVRASLVHSYIGASLARKLFDEADSRPGSQLDGNLQDGFAYWAVTSDDGLRLVGCQVLPVAAQDVPEDVRARLSAAP